MSARGRGSLSRKRQSRHTQAGFEAEECRLSPQYDSVSVTYRSRVVDLDPEPNTSHAHAYEPRLPWQHSMIQTNVNPLTPTAAIRVQWTSKG